MVLRTAPNSNELKF